MIGPTVTHSSQQLTGTWQTVVRVQCGPVLGVRHIWSSGLQSPMIAPMCRHNTTIFISLWSIIVPKIPTLHLLGQSLHSCLPLAETKQLWLVVVGLATTRCLCVLDKRGRHLVWSLQTTAATCQQEEQLECLTPTTAGAWALGWISPDLALTVIRA